MCSNTPRFSYRSSKTVICTCPTVPATVASAVYDELWDGVWDQGGYTGGYTGWVQGRAIPGTQPAARGDPADSGAGPGSPAGAGVGGLQGRANQGTAAVPGDHPAGPVGLTEPSLSPGP